MTEEEGVTSEKALLKNLGRNLRKQREVLGMAEEELSSKSGVKIKIISKIESGIMTNLKFGTLLDLCAALNIVPHSLFEKAEEA
jgi:transcriptional regulator with XRE-family HTH domain